jgi:predicted metalloprotease with PDZ domain
LLPYRYGAWQRDLIFRSIANNYGQALTNSSRLQTSPYESSYRLAEAASAKGTGSNGGYKISFYTFGFLCGVCLDLEIRSRSNNQHSLDDVMRALFDECKNDQPGFEEDEIRKQCVRFGGPELGTFYDRIVMTPGELPIVDELAKAGLLIGQETAQLANLGFDAVAGPDGKTVVRRVSPSQTGVLKQGDTITEVDGFSSSAKDPYRVADLLSDYSFANHTAALKVTVIRDGQTMELLVQPSIRSQTRWQISEDPKASDSAVRVRQDWLRTIKLAG